MKDMDKAVRIETTIENQERILVFGDYDVDGTTAVSLVSSYLKVIILKYTYIPVAMTKDTVFHSKELILQKTMVLLISSRLWY
jgi:single-stranded DNA-specific DHH superfamily exonuclease